MGRTLGNGGALFNNSVNYCALNGTTPLSVASAYLYVNTKVAITRNVCETRPSAIYISFANSSAFFTSNVANVMGTCCGRSSLVTIVLSGSAATVAKRRPRPNAKHAVVKRIISGIDVRTMLHTVKLSIIRAISPLSLPQTVRAMGQIDRRGNIGTVVFGSPYVTVRGSSGETTMSDSGYVDYGGYVHRLNYPTVIVRSYGMGVSAALYANYRLYTGMYPIKTVGGVWEVGGER